MIPPLPKLSSKRVLPLKPTSREKLHQRLTVKLTNSPVVGGGVRGFSFHLSFHMEQTTDLDQLRNSFRDSYENYVEEGRRMRDLLMRHQESSESERSQAISHQQQRLDLALRRYEEARRSYVTCVLADCVGSGGAQL